MVEFVACPAQVAAFGDVEGLRKLARFNPAVTSSVDAQVLCACVGKGMQVHWKHTKCIPTTINISWVVDSHFATIRKLNGFARI